MAKVTGTQSVPSELLDLYRGTLGEQTPTNSISQRYPFRVPTMQTETGHPSAKQLNQRARFNTVRGNFETLSPGDRARWYDSMPPWGSVLWYYNYFMLSGLSGNANILEGGAGVIKSIQYVQDTIPIGGKTVTFLNAIDVTKTVIILWGNSYNYNTHEVNGGIWVSPAWPVYPVWTLLTSNGVDISWATTAKVGADVTVQVIEYI